MFSTSGGMGQEAEKFHRRLASLIAEKRNTPYSDCMSYLRKKVSFCLLRTILAALRGYRGRPGKQEFRKTRIFIFSYYNQNIFYKIIFTCSVSAKCAAQNSTTAARARASGDHSITLRTRAHDAEPRNYTPRKPLAM